jgi:hypothetical protein
MWLPAYPREGAAGSIAASPDEESQAFLADADARELVEHTLRLSECDGLGVDALFFVGGYSVLYLPAPFEHAFPHTAQCSLPGLCAPWPVGPPSVGATSL